MCLSNLHWYAASHGLICYTNTDLEYEHNIFLWNPTIRIIKILHDPFRLVAVLYGLHYHLDLVKKLDFKVVKILDNYQTTMVDISNLNRHSWKTISDNNLIRRFLV